jgi:uncharacterized membrane protein YfcA
MTPALVGITALAAASVQAATGLGFALVLTPVLFALLSPAGAILTATVLGVELNLLVLLAERRRPRIAWHEVVPLLLAALPGTIVGILLLRALSKPVLQVTVGVAVLVAALVRARVDRTARTSRTARASRAARASGDGEAASGPGSGSSPARLALGFTSGALTTSTGVSGPPVALWLARCGLTPGELRDSLSAIFLAIGIAALVALIPVQGRAHLDPTLIAAGVACVVGGHALGSRAFTRLAAHRFEPLLLTVIAAAGIASIVAGAGSL